MLLIFVFFLISGTANALIFNLSDIVLLEVKSSDDIQFGYSVLLQHGNPNLVIVGAPRAKQYEKTSGSVYQCRLTDRVCQRYQWSSDIVNSARYDLNGASMGYVIDGELSSGGKFYTCAPRINRNAHLNGMCFEIPNSLITYGKQTVISPLESPSDQTFVQTIPFYKYSFAEAGMDLVYIQNRSEILIGSPGISRWSGGLIRWSSKYNISDVISVRFSPSIDHSYYGYKLGFGRFTNASDRITYISGEPRAHHLTGKVTVFEFDQNRETTINISFYGEKMSSYFGASLLAKDVTNDGLDDLFIGAPMYPGKTYDEGCVYFYRTVSQFQFEKIAKLMGSEKEKSRFGTAIADLGDINLDSFNDIAISAPYEGDKGAVYIYLGGLNGIESIHSQRLSPEDFPTPYLGMRGFGFSISKGNDIDNNGHNDIAIGAYKSNQVVVIKSFAVVDFHATITPKVAHLYLNDTKFDLSYCLSFKSRNGKKFHLDLNVTLILDPRATVRESYEIMRIGTLEVVCNNVTVNYENPLHNSTAFQIKLIYKRLDQTEEKHYLTTKLGFFLDCGDDNVCQTDLALNAFVLNRMPLVSGRNKNLTLKVDITNKGEPAYITVLKMKLPEDLELINIKECILEETVYSCPVGDVIHSKVQRIFELNINKIYPSIKYLNIDLSVGNSDNERESKDNHVILKIPLNVEHNLKLLGTTEENFNYEHSDGMLKETLTYSQGFYLINDGPSPFVGSIELFIPPNRNKEETVYEILEVVGSAKYETVSCQNIGLKKIPADFHFEEKFSVSSERVLYFGSLETNYLKYVCESVILYNNDKMSVSVKIKFDTGLLKKYFKMKDVLAFTAVGFVNNDSKRLSAISSILLHYVINKSIPLWIYVVAALAGFTLLCLIVFILYKLNFFRRGYKGQLQVEQQLVEESDESNKQETL